MVSLLIGSLVIAIVLQFVVGQSRYAASQTGREEAQQNLRGALEIVASDLRGTISAGIELAGEQELEFVLPRMWGVVCATAGGTTTTAMFPNLGITPPAITAGMGLIVRDTAAGGVWRPVAPAARADVGGWVVASTTASPGCGDLSPQGAVVAFTFTGTNHPAAVRGSRIALYERVRYDVGTLDGQRWLYRSGGMTGNGFSMQPLAGPIDPSAFAFRYFASAGAAAPALIVAPGTGAPAANIRLVRFSVRTRSRQSSGEAQTREDSVTVQIRNDNTL
jgi:hypothetical protein